MGKDSENLFKKRKAKREKRKHDTKNPNPNSYLIVTEGECTEPYYFEGLIQLIKDKYGSCYIDVEIVGAGCATTALVKKADELVNRAKIIYKNIWLVFDKDGFEDFDEAIRLAENKGYKVAWTNQCFEYFIYLHFAYSDSALHRHEWQNKVSELFNDYSLGEGTYENAIKAE